MNQHEFILGCQQYYAENGYEPGNPEDGEWHDCHYPVPLCKGGTEKVKLLKEHHAIHGVLQSEEYQYPCIYGWEGEYLEGELLELFNYWRSELSRLAGKSGTKTQIENKIGIHGMTNEERAAICDYAREFRDIEKVKKSAKERGLEDVKQKRGMFKRTKEEWSSDAAKGGRIMASQVWMSTVDGYTGNPGNVVRHNKANGWDPDQRVRIS